MNQQPMQTRFVTRVCGDFLPLSVADIEAYVGRAKGVGLTNPEIEEDIMAMCDGFVEDASIMTTPVDGEEVVYIEVEGLSWDL